jgi:hypothetical protein
VPAVKADRNSLLRQYPPGLSISAIKDDEHTTGGALLVSAAQAVEYGDCSRLRQDTALIHREKHFQQLKGSGMWGVKEWIITH